LTIRNHPPSLTSTSQTVHKAIQQQPQQQQQQQQEEISPQPRGRKTVESAISSSGLAQSSRIGLHVFQPHPVDFHQPELEHTLEVMMMMTPSSSIQFVHHLLTLEEQKEFLQEHASQCYTDKDVLLQQWEQLTPTLKMELWKYCALYAYSGIFMESEGVLLQPLASAILTESSSSKLQHSIAALSTVYEDTIHSGFLAMKDTQSPIMKQMVDILVETSVKDLERDSLFLSQMLYRLVSAEIDDGDASEKEDGQKLIPGVYGEWTLWSLSCHFDPLPVSFKSGSDLGQDVGGGAPWGEQRLQTKLERNLEGVIGRGTHITVPRYHRYVGLRSLRV